MLNGDQVEFGGIGQHRMREVGEKLTGLNDLHHRQAVGFDGQGRRLQTVGPEVGADPGKADVVTGQNDPGVGRHVLGTNPLFLGQGVPRSSNHRMPDLDQGLAVNFRMRWEVEGAAGQVDIAFEQGWNDGVDNPEVEIDFDPRILLVEFGDDRRQDGTDPDWPGCDAQGSGNPFLHGADLGEGMLIFNIHQPRPSKQNFPFARQQDPLLMPFEQRCSDADFQLFDTFAQSRLADM